MGLGHSPFIVTDSLALCLDAGNTRSYPGSGSNFNDLIRGNNFVLSNPSYYSFDNGSIRFTRNLPPTAEDGGYATFTGSGDLASASYLHNDHTTEVWFKSNNRSATAYDATEGVSSIVVYRGFHNMWYYGPTSYSYTIWGQTAGANDVYTLSISDSTVNVWTQLVAVRNGTTLTLYKNGVQQNTGTITAGTAGIPSSNDIRIAAANYNGSFAWHADINFASLKMYKKALSSTEVAQNFNALRTRFGI